LKNKVPKYESDGGKVGELSHYKTVKVPVVAYSNTIVDPGAMMVKFVDAAVALEAVAGPWRPQQLTLEAKSRCVVYFQQL